jgi:uncharacterized protein YbjT (DUF2867 family)
LFFFIGDRFSAITHIFSSLGLITMDTKKQHRTLSAMVEDLRNRIRFADHNAGADIFLTTSTDVVDSRVANSLIDVGSKVRVGIDSDQTDSQVAKDLKKRGVTVVPFSWDDESTYSNAVQGVKTVFCVVPQHKGSVKRFNAFFEACRKNGVKHFVKLSFYKALVSTRVFSTNGRADNPFCRVPLIRMHGDCDERIMKSHAMDYTILFVTHPMSDPALYQRHNIMSDPSRYYSASAGQGVNYVSPNDIAAAAVCVLRNPKDHRRVGYTLTGPTHIMDTQVANLLSKDIFTDKDIKREVEHYDVAPKDYGCSIYKSCDTSGASITDNTMVRTNTEANNVDVDECDPKDDLVQLEILKATGMEVKFLSKDFQKLCGRPAETFGKYLATKSKMTLSERMVFEDFLFG